MSGEAIQVTYELDERDHRIGYIAVYPLVSESVVQDFGEDHNRLLGYEIVEQDDHSKAWKLTVGNTDESNRMRVSELFSVAYTFCHVAELAGLQLDLVKSDEHGVEPSVNGFETMHFGNASR